MAAPIPEDEITSLLEPPSITAFTLQDVIPVGMFPRLPQKVNQMTACFTAHFNRKR